MGIGISEMPRIVTATTIDWTVRLQGREPFGYSGRMLVLSLVDAHVCSGRLFDRSNVHGLVFTYLIGVTS